MRLTATKASIPSITGGLIFSLSTAINKNKRIKWITLHQYLKLNMHNRNWKNEHEITLSFKDIRVKFVSCLGQWNQLFMQKKLSSKSNFSNQIGIHKLIRSLKCRTCIAVTNSAKPKNPWRLESARAQSCLSWERDKLESAKNFVASFPLMRPSLSAIKYRTERIVLWITVSI